MLRLKPQTESRWVELPNGVRIKLRPLTTPYVAAARNEARKRVAAMLAEEQAQEAAGFAVDEFGPTLANPSFFTGMVHQVLTEALLRFAAEEWEGVGDEAGNPLPIDAASARAFSEVPDMAEAFILAALAPDAVSAEGNGSAPASPSSGQAGANIAPDAEMSAPPVPLN